MTSWKTLGRPKLLFSSIRARGDGQDVQSNKGRGVQRGYKKVQSWHKEWQFTNVSFLTIKIVENTPLNIGSHIRS